MSTSDASMYRLQIRIDTQQALTLAEEPVNSPTERRILVLAEGSSTIGALKTQISKTFAQRYADEAKSYAIRCIQNKMFYELDDKYLVKDVFDNPDTVNVVGARSEKKTKPTAAAPAPPANKDATTTSSATQSNSGKNNNSSNSKAAKRKHDEESTTTPAAPVTAAANTDGAPVSKTALKKAKKAAKNATGTPAAGDAGIKTNVASDSTTTTLKPAAEPVEKKAGETTKEANANGKEKKGKGAKEPKEPKELKEPKEPKEPKESKEPKDPKEPKEPKEPKANKKTAENADTSKQVK
ncbi:hypothetical protein BGZ70_005659, partial [Mortierella alpina]